MADSRQPGTYRPPARPAQATCARGVPAGATGRFDLRTDRRAAGRDPRPPWSATCPRRCTPAIGCTMPNCDPRLLDQAIEWMIGLRFNVADDASTAAFERWLHTSAEHQQVWQRVATMNDDFKQLPAQVGRHALRGARQRISRREGLKAAGAGGRCGGVDLARSRLHTVAGLDGRLPHRYRRTTLGGVGRWQQCPAQQRERH